MNTMTVSKSMLNSRKFRMAVIDAVVTIVLLWVGYLVNDPELHQLIVATIAALQAPVVAYIAGVAIEDAATKQRGQNDADEH